MLLLTSHAEQGLRTRVLSKGGPRTQSQEGPGARPPRPAQDPGPEQGPSSENPVSLGPEQGLMGPEQGGRRTRAEQGRSKDPVLRNRQDPERGVLPRGAENGPRSGPRS